MSVDCSWVGYHFMVKTQKKRPALVWNSGTIKLGDAGNLVEASFRLTSKNLLGIARCRISLAMGKNDRIDPLAAAHTVPIDRSDFEHFFRNHEAAASMAAVGSPPLLCDE